MSLGFLTESALVPSKSKPIQVDAKSIVDLKAVVFEKEKERNERKRQLLAELHGDTTTSSAIASKRVAGLATKRRRKESIRVTSNAGVELRRQKDEQARDLELDEDADDAEWRKKSAACLKRKAELYESLASGRVLDSTTKTEMNLSEVLVDFTSKAPIPSTVSGSSDGSNQSEGYEVAIEDEFGRTRMVKCATAGAAARLAASQNQKTSTNANQERQSQNDKPAQSVSQAGSFVVSQWEHTLSKQEKNHLEQVHDELVKTKRASSQVSSLKSKKLERLARIKASRSRSQQQRQEDTLDQSSTATACDGNNSSLENETLESRASDFLNSLV